MASKYEKGKLIESIDEMLRQPRVYVGSSIYPRKTFTEWGIKYVLLEMKENRIRYAMRIKEKEKDA